MSEAIWALVGVVIGGALAGCVQLLLQTRQFQHETSVRKQQTLGADVAKEILAEMLKHKSHVERSFRALRKPIGGFSDDEVRQMLHEVDARRVERDNRSEWWYSCLRQEVS